MKLNIKNRLKGFRSNNFSIGTVNGSYLLDPVDCKRRYPRLYKFIRHQYLHGFNSHSFDFKTIAGIHLV